MTVGIPEDLRDALAGRYALERVVVSGAALADRLVAYLEESCAARLAPLEKLWATSVPRTVAGVLLRKLGMQSRPEATPAYAPWLSCSSGSARSVGSCTGRCR